VLKRTSASRQPWQNLIIKRIRESIMRLVTLATAAIVGLLISLATPSANASTPDAPSGSWAQTAAILNGAAIKPQQLHRHSRRHHK